MEPAANPASAKRLRRSRPLALSFVLIFVTMIAGVAIRFAPFGLPRVIVKYGGSMLWALTIYWVVSTLLPSLRSFVSALITAALTGGVEFFKLHHSPVLDAFRQTIPGMLLLGRFFSIWDILAYWLAISIGLLIDHRIFSNADLTSRPDHGHN
jgi:Protein of unknown function (DUF2809)